MRQNLVGGGEGEKGEGGSDDDGRWMEVGEEAPYSTVRDNGRGRCAIYRAKNACQVEDSSTVPHQTCSYSGQDRMKYWRATSLKQKS